MIEKYYNRKKTMVIFYVISFVLIILGGCFSIYTITIESWKLVGMTLLVAAIGLLLLIGIFNKHNDVIINYENNEVIVNINLIEKKKCAFLLMLLLMFIFIIQISLNKILKLKNIQNKQL